MCQPGSTRPSSFASTVAPGAATAGSSVSDHFTRSFCANAGTVAAQMARRTARLNHDALQFIFNAPVYIFARKFGGYANRILDGIGVRPPVTDYAHTLDAQQRRAAVFGVVHALLEIREGRTREQIAHLPGDRGLERFLQHLLQQIDQAFAHLERNIADEAVADDDVRGAAIDVA